jgi:hypothetical protein
MLEREFDEKSTQLIRSLCVDQKIKRLPPHAMWGLRVLSGLEGLSKGLVSC